MGAGRFVQTPAPLLDTSLHHEYHTVPCGHFAASANRESFLLSPSKTH